VREIAEAKMKDLNATDVDAGDDKHDRRLGPFHGPRGGGLIQMAHLGKRTTAPPARASTLRSSIRSPRRSSSSRSGRSAKFDETVEVAL
jgi:hypothetical protein